MTDSDRSYVYEDASGTTRKGGTVDAGGSYLDEGGYDESHQREDPESPFVGESLIALLVLGGAILFFFPEPATSMVGVGLLALGVILWVADAVR